MKDKYKNYNMDSEEALELVNLVGSHIDDSLGYITNRNKL
jgi:hypothetical protein